jgi:hypothetical protein
MAKKAKKIQTDYTKGGRDISNTAIPLYQTNLQQIADYNNNPSARIDENLDKYYTNTTAQNDFITEYNRAMANKTAQNYSATGGGYSSAGQRSYDDLQRYENKLASQLYDQGVANAAAMAQQDFNNLLYAGNAYNQAYNLGKEYSDIEQYNNMVNQNNKWYNQIGQVLPAVGSAVGSIWGPVGSAAGNAIGKGLGGMMSVDTSNYFGNQGAGSSQGYGLGVQGGQYSGGPWEQLSNIITNNELKKLANKPNNGGTQ